MKKIVIACVWLLAACSAAAPPKAPSAELAQKREQMIAWLDEYQEAGVYPMDERGWPLSVFRDAHGVRCPMAELMHRSGRDDLVEWAVTTDNHLRLADVHAGPIADWMATSGFTRDEIAMVQGAMDIQYPTMRLETPRLNREGHPVRTVLEAEARGRVRGRIETATVALRGAQKPVQKVVAQKPVKQPVAQPTADHR